MKSECSEIYFRDILYVVYLGNNIEMIYCYFLHGQVSLSFFFLTFQFSLKSCHLLLVFHVVY